MATITSAAIGNASVGTTWVGGIAPVNGDKVIIAHASTALRQFSTDAVGYAIGATAITLTGTVLAGSYVVGESVQFGTADKTYYPITAWNSATKVLTIGGTGLVMAIPAVATLARSCGHVVTIDTATVEWGDDTSTAVTNNGTIYWSRSATSQLTVQGELVLATNGTWDRGRSIDAIPVSVTATLKTNRSAALVDGKWGVTVQGLCTFWEYGAVKTTNAHLVSSIIVGATTARVTNGVGWAVGDRIIFGGTASDALEQDVRTIATITLVSGTQYDVTFAATTFAHAALGIVGNFTHNIITTVFNTTYRSYFNCQWGNSIATGIREMRYVTFEEYATNTPGGVYAKQAGLTIQGSSAGDLSLPWISIGDISFYQTLAGQAMWQTGANGGRYTAQDLAVYSAFGNFMLCYNGGVGDFYRIYTYRAGSVSNGYSEGTRNARFYDCVFTGVNGQVVSQTGSVKSEYYRCYFYASQYPIHMTIANALYFKDCYFGAGGTLTPIGAGLSQTFFVNSAAGSLGDAVLQDCYFQTGKTMIYQPNWNNASPFMNVSVLNKDANITSQELHYLAGSFYRDNTTKSRGKSSIRYQAQTTAAQAFKTIYIPAANNVAVTIKGRLRKNVSYGAATRPTVTLSGLGIVAQTFTMTDTTDTWEEFTFNVTQSSGNDGSLELIFTCQSTSTLAMAYLDGVLYSPFSQYIDFYGYKYAPTTPTLTVDSIITQTVEATVAAYTGISIAGTTITVSTNHTMKEIYDYCQYYRVINQLAPFLTSSDGVSYNSDYSIDITGTAILSGTGGTLTVLTGKTATMAAGATLSNLQIVSVTSGNTGLLSIVGIPANSSVAVYDNTGAQVDYVPSSPATYTKFLTLANTGTWKYIIKLAGYSAHIATFDANNLVNVTASVVQKLNSDGTVAYTASTSALGTVTFSTTVQANIDIANGTYPLQAVFDEAEVAMTTSNGMNWLAAGLSEISIFNSSGGDFLFLPTKWRLRRAAVGDVNATLSAFAISADGVPTDGVNGSVAYLTSDSPTAIAAAVLAIMVGSPPTGSLGAHIKTIKQLAILG